MWINSIQASKWGQDEKYKATGITIQGNDSPQYELLDIHSRDCCEEVYADWEHMAYYPSIPSGNARESLTQIKLVGDIESPDFIEPVEGVGFKIKCEQGYILVSCYNIQNGYYSSDLAIRCVKGGENCYKHTYLMERVWERNISPDCLQDDIK